MKILALVFVVAGVVFGLAFLALWWVLPRKHVTKEADGSTWVSRDRKSSKWFRDDEPEP